MVRYQCFRRKKRQLLYQTVSSLKNIYILFKDSESLWSPKVRENHNQRYRRLSHVSIGIYLFFAVVYKVELVVHAAVFTEDKLRSLSIGFGKDERIRNFYETEYTTI